VIIGLGVTDEVIDTAVEQVDGGAREAGRDPDDIEKWFVVDTNVRDDRETAIDEVKMSLASFAHMSLQMTLEGKAVPEDLQEDIKTLVKGYDPHLHGKPNATHNRDLVESLGLTEYLHERYAIAGTPEECIQKIQCINDTGKVAGIQFASHVGRDHEITERLGQEVLPEVR
jgi:alkanesulfonate monooxygenase SsuD/methylene tetrahydromethanopterin reductase-like flavin-dependent oxidoreductase (luciferase family)